MLDDLYFKDGHLTSLAFLMLDSGRLSDRERELVLIHLESCRSCMDMYVDSLSDDVLMIPPNGLEDKIIDKVHEEYKTKKKSKVILIQFTKLGVAVCLTMVLFMGGVFGFIGKASKDFVQYEPLKIEQKVHKRINENQFAKSLNKGFSQITDKLHSGFIFRGVETNETN